MNASNLQGYSALPSVYVSLCVAAVVGVVAVLVAESFLSFPWRAKIVVFIAAMSAIVGICGGIAKWKYDEYVLSPDNAPTIWISTIHSSEESGIVFGGYTFDIIDKFPFALITMNGRPLLTLDLKDGHLVIKELTLYDDRHDTIATIMDNAITFVSPNIPPPERPNRSTLIIRDHNDDVAFSVYFRNPHIIEINGIFRNKSFPLVIDEKTGLFVGNGHGGGYYLSLMRFHDHRLEQTDAGMKFVSDVRGTTALIIAQK